MNDMNTKEQARLGFNQIRAAVVGGHSVIDSWCELAGMQRGGNAPNVIDGALFCLLHCITAIESSEPLPEIEDPRLQQIFQGGHDVRWAACVQALKSGSKDEIHELVAVMAALIQPKTSQIVFIGNNLPRMESLNHPKGKNNE